jgi:rubrerythrin
MNRSELMRLANAERAKREADPLAFRAARQVVQGILHRRTPDSSRCLEDGRIGIFARSGELIGHARDDIDAALIVHRGAEEQQRLEMAKRKIPQASKTQAQVEREAMPAGRDPEINPEASNIEGAQKAIAWLREQLGKGDAPKESIERAIKALEADIQTYSTNSDAQVGRRSSRGGLDTMRTAAYHGLSLEYECAACTHAELGNIKAGGRFRCSACGGTKGRKS